MTARTLDVEIAAQSSAGARIAVAGGASRVELGQALRLGGLTPSAGLIADAVELSAGLAGFVHVLVRPRGGGFVYDRDEVATMVRDIRVAARLGAAGVVIGALTGDGLLARDTLERLIDAAEDLDVTVHRAVDASIDPVAAVASLHELRVRRVLTSGGAVGCAEGLATLARMVDEAAGGIEVMAGGGVSADLVPALARVGVDAVHLSASRGAERGASGPGGGTDGFEVTDADIVAAVVTSAAGTGAAGSERTPGAGSLGE